MPRRRRQRLWSCTVKTPIDFYFDFSSPYSYIASEWVEALAARHGRTVRWHAILLGATFQAAELKSPVSHPIKREYSLHDFARSARFDGVPYVQPRDLPDSDAERRARVLVAARQQDRPRAAAWARAGLRAYFTRGVDLSDTGGAEGAGQRVGLDADAAEAAWNDPVWKVRLKPRQRRGHRGRRVRRALLRRRRRAVLGQRPQRADRALADVPGLSEGNAPT